MQCYELDFQKDLFDKFLRSDWLHILKEKDAVFINAITRESARTKEIIICFSFLLKAVIESCVYADLAPILFT